MRIAGELRTLIWLLAALLAYAAALAAITVPLDLTQFRAVFSEHGPFERLTIPLWLLLAAACLLLSRRYDRRLAIMGGVAVLFALREADWHFKHTGGNILRFKYYLHNPAPLSEKIPAGLVSLLALAVLVSALVLLVRLLRTRSAYREPWVWTLLVGLAVGAGVKMLDRVSALAAQWFGLVIDGLIGRLVGAFEEGFECALPVIFGLALWQYCRLAEARRALCRAAPSTRDHVHPPQPTAAHIAAVRARP